MLKGFQKKSNSPMGTDGLSFWNRFFQNFEFPVSAVAKGFAVVISSYSVASLVGVGSAVLLVDSLDSQKQTTRSFNRRRNYEFDSLVARTSSNNFVDIKRRVLDRNLFNREGTLPVEEEPQTDQPVVEQSNYEDLPCEEELSLPFQIQGVAFTPDPKGGYVLIVDQQQNYPDVYKPGQLVMGHEAYRVFKVYSNNVEFIKDSTRKICAVLAENNLKGEPTLGAAMPVPAAPQLPTETVSIPYSTVREQLDAGAFAKQKLFPHTGDSEESSGFRLGPIKADSLFEKLKLQRGDVITKVKGTSLSDPSKITELMSALETDSEFEYQVYRNGELKIMKVEVK